MFRHFVLSVLFCPTLTLAADAFGDHVVSFSQGSGANPAYADPTAALGTPERFTGEGSFPGAVTPFNPPFNPEEVVTLGAGGSLTISFDEPIRNDPANLYGIDLIIFSNTFFIDTDYPVGRCAGVFGIPRAAHLEVSADGQSWFELSGAFSRGLFPTLGYSDLTSAYATSPGSVLSDFTRPVDPSFQPNGSTFDQIVNAYAGSGGGIGVDIAPSGLSAISFVRVTNDRGFLTIDAISDAAPAPTPGAPLLLGCAGALTARRRRPPFSASSPRR